MATRKKSSRPALEAVAESAKPLDLDAHPLSRYIKAHDAARTLLVLEQQRLEGLGNSDALSEAENAKALADALEVNSAIGDLDAVHQSFMVKIFAGIIPPSEAVVAECEAMNRALAQIVVDANRPAVLIRTVTKFVTFTTAVVNGEVPPSVADTGGAKK